MALTYPPKPLETGAKFTSILHGDTYPAITPAQHADLSNRIVFITGASRGIGLATAKACAAAGCTQLALAANDGIADIKEVVRAAAPESTRESLEILTLDVDVREEASVGAAAAAIEKAFGGLDVLVNNAGYMESGKPLAESDPDDWWKTWEVNVRGNYLVTRAMLPLLLKRGDEGLKTIVNLGSSGALSYRPGGSSYRSSKWAIFKLTEYVMAEYADKGILCYTIHPGGILTEMAKRMPEEVHSALSDKPELAGDTIVFLSHKRREWLAGRYISCRWDMPEFLAREKEIVDGDKLKLKLVV
ncbi:uncharacterized protein K452DRAFT_293214 [Aplosporella prunicola CBS 121167]|uniref:Oxidoreductase n=1 Tax=Aplosporella prunicola CBS 121167 TaxID=1176127 RepID=A0A6A6AUU3_9PEZI|nr:uncharacterized protein K452DRAFT_293214 [Aplosporella prunicola CBS 121167]KAF2135440.1 hypothetical protein K452DRAFT_293214 [Aplosporella prunicola CBS 121167]